MPKYYKLPSYGIAGQELNWMTDYLFSRHQFVQIEKYNSSLQPCHNEVPQGSKPLCFNAFFNVFSSTLQNTEAVMYADDSVTKDEDLTKDLAKIKSYFDDKELVISMNVGKTEVMNCYATTTPECFFTTNNKSTTPAATPTLDIRLKIHSP